jgi:hypothetical protein
VGPVATCRPAPARRKHNTDDEGYRRPWSKEEDERLAMLVELQGVGSWAQIAYDMPSRNGKQCREHWHNQLSGEVTVRRGTAELPRLTHAATQPSRSRAARGARAGATPCPATALTRVALAPPCSRLPSSPAPLSQKPAVSPLSRKRLPLTP